MSVDLATIARDLKTTPEKVETTVQLLDDGNTIPFITRFRKDDTGGLNEKQIQAIKQFVQRKRTLQERKEFILKSIESQGKLTEELKADIGKANTARYLEDLYLPFKPKKQSLAMTARQQGLEPLATEIFEGKSPEVDLAARATDYVRVDKGLSSVDDVIAGVGQLIAERFSENRKLRSELRKIVWNTGQLVSKSVESKLEKHGEPDGEPAATAAVAMPGNATVESTSPVQKPVTDLAPATDAPEATAPETTANEAETSTAASTEAASTETASTETASTESASA